MRTQEISVKPSNGIVWHYISSPWFCTPNDGNAAAIDAVAAVEVAADDDESKGDAADRNIILFCSL